MAYYNKKSLMYNMSSIMQLKHKIEDIPEAWIYKFYYKRATGKTIIQPFDGRSVRVKSIANRDSNPSLFFFYKDKRYYWKDFSSGQGGDAVDFASGILGKYRSFAIPIIVEEFERYSIDDDFPTEDYEISERTKTKIKTKICRYTDGHIDYFKRFKITVDVLARFNAFANDHYTIETGSMYKMVRNLSFSFQAGSKVYQIYQPNQDPKYITLDTDYLIGLNQLAYKSDTCAIVSGLKDIMAITILGLDCEYVASYSESILLSSSNMNFLKTNYKNVISILDNDTTGIRMMKVYEKTYGVRPALIRIEKDLADNNEKNDIYFLKEKYAYEINKAINK